VGVLLLTHILQLLSQKDLYFIHRFCLGYDFKRAWGAAVDMSKGVSPCLNESYVWPTFVPCLLLHSGMMRWGFDALAQGMVFLNLGCVLLPGESSVP
jgi:hypothetical protein